MATLNIPVELAYTEKLKPHTQCKFATHATFDTNVFLAVRTFASSPIRLFIDNGLPVTICSFRDSFNSQGRAEMISSQLLRPTQYYLTYLKYMILFKIANWPPRTS